MNAARHFLDTNIFIYTFDRQAPNKAKRAEDLVADALDTGAGMISYQVAQEFVAVARKPFRTPMTFEQIEKYWLTTLRPLLLVQFSPGCFFARWIWLGAITLMVRLAHRCGGDPGRLRDSLQRRPATWPSLRRSRCSDPFL